MNFPAGRVVGEELDKRRRVCKADVVRAARNALHRCSRAATSINCDIQPFLGEIPLPGCQQHDGTGAINAPVERKTHVLRIRERVGADCKAGSGHQCGENGAAAGSFGISSHGRILVMPPSVGCAGCMTKPDNPITRSEKAMKASIDQLHAFLAVAETGHLTRAAERLGLSQSSLSDTIGKLESILGARLFERNTRGCRLSAAGAALAPLAGAARRGMAASDG